MARYNETIDTTPAAIRDFAATLRMIADTFDQQADTLEKFGTQFITTTHWKSARRGVEGFTAFAGAIQDAILQSRLMPSVDAMPIATVEASQKIAGLIEAGGPRRQRKKPSK